MFAKECQSDEKVRQKCLKKSAKKDNYEINMKTSEPGAMGLYLPQKMFAKVCHKCLQKCAKALQKCAKNVCKRVPKG